MKFYHLLIFLSIIFMVGCTGSDSSNNEPVATDTINEVDSINDSAETGQSITNIPSLWDVEVQPDHSEKLRQPRNNNLASMAPQALINALNESYPGIQLNLNKISKDTIYISIPESKYLSDQIGSTGAYNYLATAVYNLTELNNIKYINLSFKGGEHASPGVYSRDDFKKLR
jgi:hypothetical protein